MSIAPAHSTEVRRYGIIDGSLDAVDKLVKKLATENVELRVVCDVTGDSPIPGESHCGTEPIRGYSTRVGA